MKYKHAIEPDDALLESQLQAGITQWIAEHEGLPRNVIDCARSLSDYGLSSVDLLELHSRILEIAGPGVDPELLWETPSIAGLIAAIARTCRAESPPNHPTAS